MSSFVAGTVIGLSVVSAVFASVADAGDTRLLLLTSAILLLVVGTALLLTVPAARGGHRRSAHRALKDALAALVTVGIVGCRAAWTWVKVVATASRAARQGLIAALRRRRRSEHERFLAGSADHFEVERRERAWDRWQSRDGSLLGR
jgi:hypothetical protein